MAAYNFIGATPVEASDAMLNSVLRDEWGFKGLVETDMFAGFGFQDADRMIRNGCDLMLSPFESEEGTVTDQTSATSLKAMRQTSKNILYTTVNSRAYAGNVSGMATYLKVLLAVDLAIAAVLIAVEAVVLNRYFKKRKNT